jgi:hypothetical protein
MENRILKFFTTSSGCKESNPQPKRQRKPAPQGNALRCTCGGVIWTFDDANTGPTWICDRCTTFTTKPAA